MNFKILVLNSEKSIVQDSYTEGEIGNLQFMEGPIAKKYSI